MPHRPSRRSGLLVYPLYTSLNPYKLEYLKVLLGKKRLNNDYAYHE